MLRQGLLATGLLAAWSIPSLVAAIATFVAFAHGEPVVLSPAEVAREYHVRTWRHQGGLPDDRVNDVLQTRDGYLWIATRMGLARFDGLKFTAFNSATVPAMRNSDCLSLAEDRQGDLWIGTSHGLCRKHGNGFLRYAEDNGFTNSPVTDLCVARDGTL